jgi:hypothetical protein
MVKAADSLVFVPFAGTFTVARGVSALVRPRGVAPVDALTI